jgi:tetratricopeptide (TPR) repeat protein
MGNTESAQATFDKAIANPTAKPTDAHQLGRQLLQQGHKAEALKIFQANAKKFPGQWPVNVGLARGYAASGDLKKALEHARMGLAQAPDEPNKKALKALIEQLEKGAAPR